MCVSPDRTGRCSLFDEGSKLVRPEWYPDIGEILLSKKLAAASVATERCPEYRLVAFGSDNFK